MSFELQDISGSPGHVDHAVNGSRPASQEFGIEESSLADGISTESSHAPLQTGGDFEASHFAQVADLAQWFPQVKEDHESKSWRIRLSRRSRALLLQITLICAIFSANVVLTVLAVLRFSSNNGVGLIYEGNCTTVGRLNLWLHLLINILSTGMLSASNYCMQLQAAPTRANVDEAHRSGKRVDIGVSSLRNLKYIGHWRRLSWAILAITSLPMHFLYNSAVFQSLTSFEYTVAVVKDSFLNGSSWDLNQAEIRRNNDPGWGNDSRVNFPANYTEIILEMQMNATKGEYTQLNISSCFDLYNDYFAPQGNVIVLVKNQTIQEPLNDSLLLYVGIMPRSDDWAKNMWALANGTSKFVLQAPSRPVTEWLLGPPRYEADYCLVQKPALENKVCRFEYSPWIMYIVCFFNLAKATTIFIIWALRRWQNRSEDVLFTLGDAIASFMKDPEPKTEGQCMATKYDFITRRTWDNRLRKSRPEPPTEGRVCSKKPRRWAQSASPRRWVMLLSICSAIILLVIVLLSLSTISLRHRSIPITISYFWSMGFGQLQAYTYLAIGLPRGDPAGLISNVLLSNLPQFILSILYIFYNSMLSTFLVQREFSHLYKEERRKPLRVSEPIGIQRSSYFISLPLRYGVPLYASSGLMHWLISSSLFLARITTLRPGDASTDTANSFSTCGYSPIAIIIALLVGTSLIIAIVAISFRKYDGTMRMVSTNSLAISAACHCLEGDRKDGYRLPVRWGVVRSQGRGGHCAFTTAPMDQVRVPDTVTLYK